LAGDAFGDEVTGAQSARSRQRFDDVAQPLLHGDVDKLDDIAFKLRDILRRANERALPKNLEKIQRSRRRRYFWFQNIRNALLNDIAIEYVLTQRRARRATANAAQRERLTLKRLLRQIELRLLGEERAAGNERRHIAARWQHHRRRRRRRRS
jgi:hypothetical protein